jgi:hypothetical protein
MAGSVGEFLQGSLVGLHLLDVTGREGIVTEKHLMTIQERLHRIGLYFTNLMDVCGLFVLRRGLPSLSI